VGKDLIGDRMASQTKGPLASQCQDSGESVERCSQQLPIPELMQNITAELEGNLFNTKVWFFGKYCKYLKGNIKRSS